VSRSCPCLNVVSIVSMRLRLGKFCFVPTWRLQWHDAKKPQQICLQPAGIAYFLCLLYSRSNNKLNVVIVVVSAVATWKILFCQHVDSCGNASRSKAPQFVNNQPELPLFLLFISSTSNNKLILIAKCKYVSSAYSLFGLLVVTRIFLTTFTSDERIISRFAARTHMHQPTR
jgi:hypothetical protein